MLQDLTHLQLEQALAYLANPEVLQPPQPLKRLLALFGFAPLLLLQPGVAIAHFTQPVVAALLAAGQLILQVDAARTAGGGLAERAAGFLGHRLGSCGRQAAF